ncbi:MAG: hypothetical protein PVF58_14215 [Candidatus Methanofastidiosia archaeon]
MSKSKGSYYERQLQSLILERPGIICEKIPGSGAGTSADKPDLIVVAYDSTYYFLEDTNDYIGGFEVFAIEVKYRSKPPVYIPHQKIESLLNYHSKIPMVRLVAAKFSRKEWRLAIPNALRMTEKGRIFEVDTGTPLSEFHFR